MAVYCVNANCNGIVPDDRIRRKSKFCSRSCRDDEYFKARRFVSAYSGSGLSTGTVGAISELVVAADLLTMGYEVFRSLSPACSWDLAVLKDGKLLRIEVRTGYKLDNGKIAWSRNKGRADHWAVVYDKREIRYDPPLSR